MTPELDQPSKVFFDASLRPHRSLSSRAFARLMIAMAGCSFFVSMIFFAVGAWPVPGFLGLDWLLLYLAFRANYRAARLEERVRLDVDKLTVCRTAPNGRQRYWEFEPTWLQIDMDTPAEHDSQLVLRSRSDRLILGSFLTPLERSEVAGALRSALRHRLEALAAGL